MKKILTLTVNPAIDKSTSVQGIRPNSKLRCSRPFYNAGGGGINVSRAIKKLGGESLSIYMAGGPPASLLKDLIEEESVEQHQIETKEWTRENLAVVDTTTEQQYRFGMPGPEVTEKEWREALEILEQKLGEEDYLVASGSLCPGIPDDFYGKVAEIARKKKARLILDTSGEALLKGVKDGVYLLKPNLGELSALSGEKSLSSLKLETIGRKLLREGTCEVLVVSLGEKGAILLTQDACEHIPAPAVHKKSTIGAGDSMVAGMVLSLAMGRSLSDVARYGVACGTAATTKEGTQLCTKKDADELYEWIKMQPRMAD
ncbi:MAG: 1-phosphofructokinase family hexose kinase [Salegentibacter sp.]